MKRILVTGSEGLIGKAISSYLSAQGYHCVGYDISSHDSCDLRDIQKLSVKAQDCDGIIHLAAVSRVVWGHNNPSLCKDVNIQGTQNVLDVAINSPKKPWVLFTSSREVYGQQTKFPIEESAPLLPMNVYAESKVQGENLIQQYRSRGLRSGIVRLSNVYGRVDDHHDRVIPAFCRAALTNQTLRIDGVNHVFDFTHLDDVILGLYRLIQKLEDNDLDFSPIHLTSGVGTTLLEAAKICIDLANNKSDYIEAPSRTYDVNKFYGDTSKAKEILNWVARITIKQGIEKLMNAYIKEGIIYENS